MIFKRQNHNRFAMTLIEMLTAMAIASVLSVAIYQMMSSIRKSFTFAQNKMDVLSSIRVIMHGLRNDLRNAIAKPEGNPTPTGEKLYIPVAPDKIKYYYFDKINKRLYRSEKVHMDDPDPDVAEMRQIMSDDGQILSFEWDCSYANSNSFVTSELGLRSRLWFRIDLKILYSTKISKLSPAEREAIEADPDSDPRVKTFMILITPRQVDWLLKATQ